MKGTGAKRNVCPGSCVSTGAKFPVAPVESAPMPHHSVFTGRMPFLPPNQQRQSTEGNKQVSAVTNWLARRNHAVLTITVINYSGRVSADRRRSSLSRSERPPRARKQLTRFDDRYAKAKFSKSEV